MRVKIRRQLRFEQSGFTLIELMISTMVFSVILLGATTAVVQIGRMYYKGVVSSRTQETARRSIEDISRTIQFNDAEITQPAAVQYTANGISSGQITVQAVCVGNVRYTYAVNAQVDIQNDVNKHRLRHALWQDKVQDPKICATNPTVSGSDAAHYMPDLSQEEPSAGGRELLGRYMRLQTFSVDDTVDPTSLTVNIIYGDDDLLLPDANNPTGCRSLIQGSQWCAAASLSTQVRQRIDPEE